MSENPYHSVFRVLHVEFPHHLNTLLSIKGSSLGFAAFKLLGVAKRVDSDGDESFLYSVGQVESVKCPAHQGDDAPRLVFSIETEGHGGRVLRATCPECGNVAIDALEKL